ISQWRYNLTLTESKFKTPMLDHQDKYMMKPQDSSPSGFGYVEQAPAKSGGIYRYNLPRSYQLVLSLHSWMKNSLCLGQLQGHPGGHGDQGLLLPRSMRLDVPKFTGEDPERWLFAITDYFSLLNTPMDQCLWIMGFNLEGAAAEWFQWMSRNGLITDWKRFKESVPNHFGPSKYEDPQGALSKLLQLATVKEYQREFKKLMNRITKIPESLLISYYISRLKPHLQRELLVAKPTTLGHRTETEPNIMDDVESGDISILNSLIEKRSPRSLQLWRSIGSGTVYVLIDNGSTHNFVLPDIVEKMQLSVQSTKALKKLGKVTHDYAQQTMEFTLVNTTYTLKGNDSLPMKRISLYHMHALLESDDVYGIYVLYNVTEEAHEVEPPHGETDTTPPELVLLLDRFGPLFQFSQSLFSSPVLLVKKKDGSYHFCVDYRALNEVTVRDKFPILTADEMFDELEARRFIRGYETTADLLTNLLRKGEFKWGEPDKAFEDLKVKLSTTPMLSLPEFEKIFIIETDAANEGIGAVLLQEAVFKWRNYLLGRRFVIRTDHRSLKEFMQQVIQTHVQHRYVRKLLGFDFKIEYKPEVQNQVADALSRLYDDAGTLTASFMAMSQPLIEFLDELKRETMELKELRTKNSTQAIGDSLQPLATPTAVWEDVSMDFITGMPLSKGFTVVLVVVDRFSKYAHFAPLPTSFNAPKVAEVFVETVIKLDGVPKSIVSDRDPVFAPLAIIPYPPGSSKVVAVDDALVERDALLRLLRQNLLAAKNRMEEKANRKRRDVEFAVGDQVLKLQPYRKITLARRLSNTLAKRDNVYEVTKLPEEVVEGRPIEQHMAICGTRVILQKGKLVKQVLVQWVDQSPKDATWEASTEFQSAYPNYDLGDKDMFESDTIG
nr:reverse transcriptase [Tanacetum cinerariifolium]